MTLLTFGLSHHTAPTAMREKLAFTDSDVADALHRLRALPGISEAAILSTCNRTEITAVADDGDHRRFIEWWARERGVACGNWCERVYWHADLSSVVHSLRVASGLDSMVIGEPQILGQVKHSYECAREAGTLGPILGRFFQHSFAVAKIVRSRTQVGASPVSVAYAAVQMASRIFADFKHQTALVVGAGETATLLARHLRKRDIGRLVIANRSLDRARQLAAELGGMAVPLNDLMLYLADADLVVSSTASRDVLLSRELVQQAIRKRRRKPVLMIDLAVPRDIDPAVAELEDVYLYGVDELHSVIADNLKARAAAAEQGEAIVENHAQEFMRWLESRDSATTIRALRSAGRGHRDVVLARARQRLAAGQPAEDVLVYLADTLSNRLMHAPSSALRHADAVEQALLLSAAHKLFDLPDQPE
ncbi:MAG: glutamyl-tRNA reductase [Nevskiaceae bacterium]|nr:MAG: glutamyl-tRNA reductase [Nevskiaceae bacterium]TBR73601.1 MAG: glutamyl-tRNA reductase [Nevskiaceae bacterium]